MINDPIGLRRSTYQRPITLSDQPVVMIVDDDASVRDAVQNLMLSAGMECIAFASTGELLAAKALDRPGCLVLDVRMPGSSGLDLQRHLAATGNPKPIVFLTGYGDIPMSVEAMKGGAVDFLTKPVRDQTLLDAVIAGIDRDVAYRAKALAVRINVERLEKLTPRERQVLHEVARGRVNKQIAFDLGISEVTVKLHRGNLMRKMQAGSIGELIRIWEVLPAAAREMCGRSISPAIGAAGGAGHRENYHFASK
ncbi:LuxR family transcriptional regulator [Afipia sp. Root123D2]|uniref:response regulator transcription factor n=1 Tax=Afipia sp. Root123D2 TaxID=1736436 RepID=UPI0006FBBF3E|nr:response regulator transcription factor [Afipia sp. Root123D2]KQW22685.1 LuxR family transcriptional regulator [Afipia sp. Root123D2]